MPNMTEPGLPAANQGATSGFRLGHLRWLDGIRGVAILMVLFYHFGMLWGGFLGVDVFFVLSGFLITALLIEERTLRGEVSLKRFYARRILRLMPAFLMLLLVTYVYTALVRTPEELAQIKKSITIALCQLTNWSYYHKVPMPSLGHTWSLSLEEQFYLIWPALLGLLLWSGLSRRQLVALLAVGIVGCAGYRAGLYYWFQSSGPLRPMHLMRLYAGLDTRADALLAGCLLALLLSWGMLPNSPRFRFGLRLASVVSLGLLAVLAVKTRRVDAMYYLGGFTVVALLVATTLAGLLTGPMRLITGVLSSTPLVWTGKISYGLYLYHIPAMMWLRHARLGFSGPVEITLIFAISFAAAAVSYYCLELPCLRLKRWVRSVPLPEESIPRPERLCARAQLAA